MIDDCPYRLIRGSGWSRRFHSGLFPKSSNKISSTSQGYKVIIIRCIRDYASFFELEFILVLFSWISLIINDHLGRRNQNNFIIIEFYPQRPRFHIKIFKFIVISSHPGSLGSSNHNSCILHLLFHFWLHSVNPSYPSTTGSSQHYPWKRRNSLIQTKLGTCCTNKTICRYIFWLSFLSFLYVRPWEAYYKVENSFIFSSFWLALSTLMAWEILLLIENYLITRARTHNLIY